LFLVTSISGRTRKEREVLYDGEVCLLEKNQGRVLGITSCFVYEAQFRTVRALESLALDATFIVELEYEYLDNAGERNKGIKKLSCQRRFYPGFKDLSGTLSGNDRLYVVPIIKDMAYRYSITGDGAGISLIISASVEYIATDNFYSNIFECGMEQPEPESNIESINWQTVLGNIGTEEAMACLENLVRMLKLKTLFGERDEVHEVQYAPGPGMTEENRRLMEVNRNLEDDIRACRNTIARLRSELREKEDIIGKLLVILEKERHK